MDKGNSRKNSLKRALEEEQGAPMASRARYPPPPPVSSPTCSFEGMHRFVLDVKRRHDDVGEPEMYQQFLDDLDAYKNGCIDMDGVLDCIKAALHRHPDLVRRYNSLMPSRLHITD
ncbi:hypothetical protein BS78_07G088800 [Paspalum vaginatum]|nr:hypothetical protein BS78_07G088800 [Paspalum vaginatum]